jgi:DNA (cytosine-5)-methyltransferase 1
MFTGIGGFDLALQNLGHEVVGACEIDKYARSVFEKHFKGVPIYNDATHLHEESLPYFDLLSGGFPCQAFSIAGKRRGFDDTRGSLFFEIARLAKEKRPSYLLLENVKGLLSHDKGQTFRTIISTLDEVGYDVDQVLLKECEGNDLGTVRHNFSEAVCSSLQSWPQIASRSLAFFWPDSTIQCRAHSHASLQSLKPPPKRL